MHEAKGPSRRADARRNRERLLAEAQTTFAEHGTRASLEQIATRAGVGIGTLYRHFPTRQDLLEALLGARFDTLTATGRTLLATRPPEAALTEWTHAFVTATTTFRGLTAEVARPLDDETTRLHASCTAMREVGAELLRRAQESGTVRADVSPADFFVLVTGVAWAHEQCAPDAPERVARLLDLLFDGLRR
ncbi:transcriptional regulator, TetR family [Streptomyces zhaozhouensis]|uniref:Transcriptional regulator, TetR family n=1 Tax=Streptomyces zhaozhouensis TaxID=1300267 RepID=A0A286E0T0_9ACTN|nr:TetR/AcrR family transcriptional regulator [Streptomyces zhaozhouensis]SOD64511.1 transcriptional regulator, TetR family [Streptomyces zhaozhouensis]